MPKYRKTICQDEGLSKGMWFYAPIDLRKNYYFCHNCQKNHLTKEGVIKEKCQCRCCKYGVDEYFCSSCGHNFNECEVFHFYHEPTGDLPSIGMAMCPKCHPKDWKPTKNLISEWGGTMHCHTSDGRTVNMADELNRLENGKISNESDGQDTCVR